jgi:hypothetical protein
VFVNPRSGGKKLKQNQPFAQGHLYWDSYSPKCQIKITLQLSRYSRFQTTRLEISSSYRTIGGTTSPVVGKPPVPQHDNRYFSDESWGKLMGAIPKKSRFVDLSGLGSSRKTHSHVHPFQ